MNSEHHHPLAIPYESPLGKVHSTGSPSYPNVGFRPREYYMDEGTRIIGMFPCRNKADKTARILHKTNNFLTTKVTKNDPIYQFIKILKPPTFCTW